MAGFEADLKALGWRKSDLAERLGISREQVSRWREPPRYATEYIRVCLELNRMNEVLFRLRGEI